MVGKRHIWPREAWFRAVGMELGRAAFSAQAGTAAHIGCSACVQGRQATCDGRLKSRPLPACCLHCT